MTTVAVGDLVDGKYRIISTIGEGGWGIVFEGENIRTFKRVALKILRPHSGVTKDILTRFEREAQAAGRIGSEHIVEVYDLGSLPDGTHYMVMELLTGMELSGRLKAGPMEPVTVAKLMLQLLDGLKAAHEAGILHRDLKPENLFLVPTRSGEEFVKILDFGISKFNNGPQGSATMTGAVLGSPCYMAPEQARGLKQVDQRTDLYSVGTLMYESLTGAVPFTGDNFNDLMFKIVLQPRPDPRVLRPDLDPGMANIIVKAMAIDPRERYQSAEELSTALQDWLMAQGVPSVRPPELKRAHSKNTPRASREPNQTPDPRMQTPDPKRASGPVEKATARSEPVLVGTPQWHDATMPAESLGTPLVSSSSEPAALKPDRRSSRNKVVAVLGASLAILVLLGGVILARGPHAKTAATSAIMDPPPPAVASSIAAAISPSPPAASLADLETPPPVDSASAQASASTSPLRPGAAAPGAAWAPPRNPGAQPPAPTRASAAIAAASAPAPQPPAPVASPAKPVSTVEGREIRTGL